MSPYLHSLEVGDKLSFSGPYGDFFLQQNSDKAVVCVAGGVGLAPMKSIINHMLDNGIKREIYLFYGARDLSLLYDHDRFELLAGKHPNFHYYPTLLDDDSAKDWKVDKGFVTTVFNDKFSVGVEAEAYVCGPPVMVDVLMPLLRNKGINENDIYYDKF